MEEIKQTEQRKKEKLGKIFIGRFNGQKIPKLTEDIKSQTQ